MSLSSEIEVPRGAQNSGSNGRFTRRLPADGSESNGEVLIFGFSEEIQHHHHSSEEEEEEQAEEGYDDGGWWLLRAHLSLQSPLPSGKMGWAKRLLKVLLGGKRETRNRGDVANVSSRDAKREKKRWSFSMARPRQGSSEGDAARSPATSQEPAVLLQQTTCCADGSEGSSKDAILVAVATAAAADVAVSAAHAAMEKLRCLSRGRAAAMLWAAISIQKVFRGYLARKALRALKALVKLQALIRGQLVRKQADATLRKLEALARAQANFTFDQRPYGLFPCEERPRMRPKLFPRRSFEKASVCETRIKYLASPRCHGSDRSPRILGVDTYRPLSRSFHATCSDVLHPHEELEQPMSSPHNLPYHLTLRNFRCLQDGVCCADAAKRRNSKTTQNTPRLPYATPARSPRTTDWIPEHVSNKTDRPSYMASTRSFSAKVRTQSTPKDRPETLTRPKNSISASKMVLETPASLVGNATGRHLKVRVAGRLDKSLDLYSEAAARDYYLDTMW